MKLETAELKELAIEAAISAGKLLKEGWGKVQSIGRKRNFRELITEFDHRAEELIIKTIKAQYPDHSILAEERPMEISNSGYKYKWIIDPLDGTTNYAHSYPLFCVSVALEHNEEIIVGVVYNPVLDELFIAEKGQGAKLNGKSISVSATKALRESLLATGFPYQLEGIKENIRYFEDFIFEAQAVRRDGSAALDLCYLAMGRFDGFWELDLKPWDVAAGALIVAEAGGRVTNLSGGRFSLYGDEILASNGHIHQEMVQVLQRGERSFKSEADIH